MEPTDDVVATKLDSESDLSRDFYNPLIAKVAHAAEGHFNYNNTYSGTDLFDNGFREIQCIAQAGLAFLKHRASFYNMPDIRAFREIANAGVGSMEYQLITSADHEFVGIVEAVMAAPKHEYNFEPMHICEHRCFPGASVTMYEQMSLLSIDDVVFQDMVDSAEAFSTTCRCQGEYGNARRWSYCCLSYESSINSATMDVTVSRDVPRAVALMHQTTNGLDTIDQLYFQSIAEAGVAYSEYSNNYNLMSDELVLAFLDIARAGLSSLIYTPPFPYFIKFPAELRIQVFHDYLLGEREGGRLSKCQHKDVWGNRCCVWEYPDVLIACDNQNP